MAESHRTLRVLVAVHAGSVLLAAGLVVLGGGPWPATVLVNLVHALGLGGLLVAALCAWRRWRRLALLELGCAACGLLLVAQPTREAPPATGDALTVLTFNLGVGLADAADVARRLEEVEPDVVLLQELTRGVSARLDRLLAARYPHRALFPGGVDGKGIVSRLPLAEVERFVLEEGRSYLRVEVDAGGAAPVTVVCVHFSPALGVLGLGSAAGRDLVTIAAELASAPSAILAGDFNSTWRSGVSGHLRGLGLTEAFETAGGEPAFTFPVFGRYFGLPIGRFLRVDQVWTTADRVATEAIVGPDLGSDHLPLLVRLATAAPREGGAN